MATDKKDWQEVDPRVQWAMDILDWGDVEPSSPTVYLGVPVFGGLVGVSTGFVRNHLLSRPLWAGAPYTLVAGVVGVGVATWYRDWKARRQQESSKKGQYHVFRKFTPLLSTPTLTYREA